MNNKTYQPPICSFDGCWSRGYVKETDTNPGRWICREHHNSKWEAQLEAQRKRRELLNPTPGFIRPGFVGRVLKTVAGWFR